MLINSISLTLIGLFHDNRKFNCEVSEADGNLIYPLHFRCTVRHDFRVDRSRDGFPRLVVTSGDLQRETFNKAVRLMLCIDGF